MISVELCVDKGKKNKEWKNPYTEEILEWLDREGYAEISTFRNDVLFKRKG